MNHSHEAERLFREGYNCSQAVFCAFRDLTGYEMNEAARLSAPFGGGMGRLREICGTVSGALLTLGVLYGYDEPGNIDVKRDHYRLVQEFAHRFEERFGALRCKELLKNIKVTPGIEPEPRTAEFYEKRPCVRIAAGAAEILDELLSDISNEKAQEDTK